MTEQTILELLRKRMAGRTQNELAREIGVSGAYLSDVFNGHRKPAEKILRYLGVEREVVYSKVKAS